MESNVVSGDAIHPSEEDHHLPQRVSAIYKPSVWGDFFLAYQDLELYPDEVKLEHKQLKEEITMRFNKTSDQSSMKLEMINNIQRLGLSYQFEDEIDASLLNVYDKIHLYPNDAVHHEENLHEVALRFRLLRHQGHRVSSDIFTKFLDNKGKWDKSSTSTDDDLRGILSLYEASLYMVHGENILEEAFTFTETALRCMLRNNASDSVACSLIDHALQWPIRRAANRVATRLYITIYQQDESHDADLLKLAKLDFNALQRMHKLELCALTKWWKKIGPAKNLGFAKDIMVENYYLVLGLYFEPQYSEARIILAKQLILSIAIDDLYDDEYATIEELLLFTHAIQSWNMISADNLPSYMRPLYKAILVFYTETEENLAIYDISKQIEHVKLEMKKSAKACYQEAYWYHNNIVPTMEEYMETALYTSISDLVGLASLIGMKNLYDEDVLKWAKSEPLIFRAAAIITRLMDDIQDHTDGSKEAGAVKCYMIQHGVSKKKAVEEIQKQVTNAWKDINAECLLPTAVHRTIIDRFVNIGRIIYTVFKDIDGFSVSNTITKKLIKTVLVDPINY